MSRWKSHHHNRVLASCVDARKSLVQVTKLLDERYDDETGQQLSEAELRDKATIAATWFQKAESSLAHARAQLTKELEHRETEADPETIRHRQFQAEVRELAKQPRRRRNVADLTPEVTRLRNEGMVPAAIADTLKTSDSMVGRILREARK
jgi:hypothetical protein